MINVLVTGGAGYIGSHTVRALQRAGYGAIVYDNFSRGHRQAVEGFTIIEGSTTEHVKLSKVFREFQINAVMHFAAHSQVGESVEKPDLYYFNNVIGGFSLLRAVLEAGVKYLIFSSSAAVYGEPEEIPISEDHILNPTNPYGETKAVLERALPYYEHAYGLNSVSLRYFNAAGASLSGGIGEDHEPETHLIPLTLQNVLDRQGKINIYGNDYNTADGTAIRDYIHVDDLAEAHLLALKFLLKNKGCAAYNLGNGKGYSVLEVVKAVEKVTGYSVPYEFGPRRPGDPAVLVAAAQRAERELGWKAKIAALEDIVESAWHWHRANPQGFKF